MIVKLMMVLKNFICNSGCFLQRTKFSCCKYIFVMFIKNIKSCQPRNETVCQSNKVLHNYTTTLRDRCQRIQDQLNQP